MSGIQRRSGIIKTDISDHFPTVFALNTFEKGEPEDKAQFICEFIYGEKQIMKELCQIEQRMDYVRLSETKL